MLLPKKYLIFLFGLQSQLFWLSITVTCQFSNQQQQQPQITIINSTNQQPQQQPQIITSQLQPQLILPPSALATLANAAVAINPKTASGGGTSTSNSNPSSNPNQQFVIKFIHNDSSNNLAYVSILPVNQSNLHEPRIELRYHSSNPFIELSESTKINSVVAALVVNDEDTGPSGEISIAIENGNELGHFKLVSTPNTNTIQVANQLNIDLKQEYNLTIVARDHGSPPKSSSVNLVIKLTQAIRSGPLLPAEPPWDSSNNNKDLMYFGAMVVVLFSTFILIVILTCFLAKRPTSKKGPPPRTTSTNNNLFELY